MSSTRRHDSLIPLSREHDYNLVVCLRIHQTTGKEPADLSRFRSLADGIFRFFRGDLKIHFETEECVLFPAMTGMPGAGILIQKLLGEHREIERIALEMPGTEGLPLTTLLERFADLLEVHVHKEERSLFPLYEQYIASKQAEQVGWEIEARIGLALQPRHPELLKQ